MNEDIIKKLVDINDRFYQSFGAAFAETRKRIQPGVQRIADAYLQEGDWLDMGCGSGALGQRLARSGMQGTYTGLDFSHPLLKEAREGAAALEPHEGFELEYRQANLFDADWDATVRGRSYDGITAFAVLHHIPGEKTRQRILHKAANLLKSGGLFIHSEWQFQNSDKLLARVQPWSAAGLSDELVDEGDVLLDWRHLAAGQTGEAGLRYVHQFSHDELEKLAGDNGFTILEEFLSDGVGGNLGLYQIWKKK